MTKKSKILFCISIIIGIALIFYTNNLDNKRTTYEGIYERPFKEYAVFYPQHQDDEVLWGGSAIRKAIKQCGVNNVFVVLISDGTGVNVFNNRKYKDLTKEEKIQLRNKEFRASLKQLGIKETNTIILSEIDKGVKNRFELMETVALEFENKFKDVTHIAQSYKYDDHPLHRKNGRVIYKLYKEGKIKDTMYFLKPKYVDKVPVKKKVIYDCKTADDYSSVKKSCMEYKKVDSLTGRHGIGYISAHNYFKHLLEDRNLTSILHLPY